MSGERGTRAEGMDAADVLAQKFSLGAAAWEVITSPFMVPGLVLGLAAMQWLGFYAPEVVSLFLGPSDITLAWAGMAPVIIVWRIAWRHHDWASARVEAKRELAMRLTGASPEQVEVTLFSRFRHAISNSVEGLAILCSLMALLQVFAMWNGSWAFGVVVNAILVVVSGTLLLPSLLLDAWRDDGSLDRARVETIYRAAVAQGVDFRGALSVQPEEVDRGGDLSMSHHAGSLGVVVLDLDGTHAGEDAAELEREDAEQAVEVGR